MQKLFYNKLIIKQEFWSITKMSDNVLQETGERHRLKLLFKRLNSLNFGCAE